MVWPIEEILDVTQINGKLVTATITWSKWNPRPAIVSLTKNRPLALWILNNGLVPANENRFQNCPPDVLSLRQILFKGLSTPKATEGPNIGINRRSQVYIPFSEDAMEFVFPHLKKYWKEDGNLSIVIDRHTLRFGVGDDCMYRAFPDTSTVHFVKKGNIRIKWENPNLVNYPAGKPPRRYITFILSKVHFAKKVLAKITPILHH